MASHGPERYPNDYHVLGMAARYEQARGDKERAADYWRAALKAMPANSPTDRLAHDLAYPDQDNSPHKAVTAGDLQLLLNPDYADSTQPFPRTVMLPPLPAYGPDPYQGRLPVDAAPVAPPQQSTEPSIPTTTQIPVPQAGVVHSGAEDLPAASPGRRQNFVGAPRAQAPRAAVAGSGQLHRPSATSPL